MLTKENYDDIKWDLMNYSTKGMWRYLPESTIEKVWDLLEKEIHSILWWTMPVTTTENKMLDPVERDFNAFSKSQSYAEDFEAAVNERVQQEVDKFFDDLIIDDVQTYLGNDNSIVLELNGNGFVLTPEALAKLSDLSTWTVQEYDDAMSEEDDKRRQYD